MTETSVSSSATFTIKYGLLEHLLQDIVGGRQSAIVSRFRKLRPKLAADGLLTETGNHVAYDLKRILAISAIFQLNALAIPQGHAVDIIVNNWVEVAQACLGAQAVATHDYSGSLPPAATLSIYIDALNGGPGVESWASFQSTGLVGASYIAFDCHRIVQLLTRIGERLPDGSRRLGAAFDEMRRDFAPVAKETSDDDPVSRPVERSLFSDGPYFDRARSLLSAEPSTDRHSLTTCRLQTYLNYLENPAPIDSWKAHIGTKAGEPRLGHFVSAWGVEIGLSSNNMGSVETLRTAASGRERALQLISDGERHVAH